MRVAHIIIIHKNLVQLARLITSLQHPHFDLYIHVDAKVPDEEFESLKNLPNVIFIKNRIECNWGGFTILKAIFNSLAEVIASGKSYGFINLMSGQDYPIRHPQQIYEFLQQQTGKNFVAYDTSQSTDWWKGAADRYEKYHLTDMSIPGKYFVERILNKFTPTRKFPEYTQLYGGNKSTWWTLSWDCAVYLNDKVKKSPKLLSFLKFCWGTDEFAIPTLIMNSPFKDQVVNDSLRYIDWSEGNPSPKVFTIVDFEKIRSSRMLFARKFDMDYDTDILNKIDEELLTEKA
jgi:hypothetical protein